VEITGRVASLLIVSVAGLPMLPAVSVKVTVSVKTPSVKLVTFIPLICWVALITAAVPVTGGVPPLVSSIE